MLLNLFDQDFWVINCEITDTIDCLQNEQTIKRLYLLMPTIELQKIIINNNNNNNNNNILI